MVYLTSFPTISYNCIAWAAGEDQRWWEPDPAGVGYWPPGVERQMTLDAYVAAYKSIGFSECSDGTLEEGYEKVVLYTRSGRPTHAARQLSDGSWTSKLGRAEDVQHDTPEDLLTYRNLRAVYGIPRCYMRRARL